MEIRVMKKSIERRLKGRQIVKGFAEGIAFKINKKEPFVPYYSIASQQINEEFSRFVELKQRLKNHFEVLCKTSDKTVKKEIEELLVSHSLIIEDPIITQEIKNYLRKKLCNSETAIYHVFNKYISKIRNLKDHYLQQRAYDMEDIRNHLISLSNLNKEVIIDKNSILVTDNLFPTDFLKIKFQNVKGILLENGGESSHSSIIAKNLDIPMLIKVSGSLTKINNGDIIMLDSYSRIVYINPNESIKEKFKKTVLSYREVGHRISQIKSPIVTTTDNKKITISVNIEATNEESLTKIRENVSGVGLYRTEYLFMNKSGFPSEEKQLETYKKIVEISGEKEVIIRTVDIGGDKLPTEKTDSLGDDSPLGYRAIRFSLKNKKYFKEQISAILRSSHYGKVSILFPMIASYEEFIVTMKIFKQVQTELKEKNLYFDSKIAIGIMVEVPSIIPILPHIIHQVDFLSIGTNDLIQYTLAMDRDNPEVAYLYQPLHTAVLNQIKTVAEIGRKYDKKVSLCGEMAGVPFYSPIMLGLDIYHLSMSPYRINDVKNAISRLNYHDCVQLVKNVINEPSNQGSNNLLKKFHRKHLKDLIDSKVVILK